MRTSSFFLLKKRHSNNHFATERFYTTCRNTLVFLCHEVLKRLSLVAENSINGALHSLFSLLSILKLLIHFCRILKDAYSYKQILFKSKPKSHFKKKRYSQFFLNFRKFIFLKQDDMNMSVAKGGKNQVMLTKFFLFA